MKTFYEQLWRRWRNTAVCSDNKAIPRSSTKGEALQIQKATALENCALLIEYFALFALYQFVTFSYCVVQFLSSLNFSNFTSNCSAKYLQNFWGVITRRSSTSVRMQHPGYFSGNRNHSSTSAAASTSTISHAEQVLDRVKRGIRLKMDKVLDAYLTGGDSDFPTCESPVWIFGRSYSVNYGKKELRDDDIFTFTSHFRSGLSSFN